MNAFNKSILTGLTLTLILSGLHYFLRSDILKEEISREYFWFNKLRQKNNTRILVLGDSRAYTAVSTEVINEKFPNKKVFNFAWPSNSYSKFYLKRANGLLERDKKNIILLSISPQSLTEYHENFVLKDYINSARHLGPTISAWASVFKIFKGPNLFHFLNGNQSLPSQSTLHKTIYHQSGHMKVFPSKRGQEFTFSQYQACYQKYRLSLKLVSELNFYLNKWKKVGHKVYAFFPPTAAKIFELEESIHNRTLSRNALKLKIALPPSSWIDLSPLKYKTYDGDHLGSKEAQKFTNDLLKYITI